ncbi:MAG TPA: folate-binding protein [Kutzneria sp.]|nr:folate-binding protein [Kutzneria sp.]
MTAVDAPAGSVDAGVPWHYGDPFAEQRFAARSAVVVDRSNREVIAVPGADRLTWLHNLTSQHVLNLRDGETTELLVLDIQGRVEHHAVLTDFDGTAWLDVEPGTGKALLAYLESMKFWSKVEPRDATSEIAVLSVVGPATPSLVTFGGLVRPMPWGADLLVPRASKDAEFTRLVDAGARPAGSLAFEALRVELLRPRLGVDTDDRTIPHEARWIGTAVHLNKGCYRGQETVSKVENVGRPPRRLLLLHLDGSLDALPETGDPVTLDGKVVGRIGSAVRHHELGPIALALIKRSVPLDAALLAGPAEEPVAASIDPDSVPPDNAALGREAVRNLGR